MKSRESQFGDFLLSMADRLDKSAANRDDVLDCLYQIDEAFGRKLDPASQFEAWAAWRFCRAVRCALQAR